jgi:hypothetical protein
VERTPFTLWIGVYIYMGPTSGLDILEKKTIYFPFRIWTKVLQSAAKYHSIWVTRTKICLNIIVNSAAMKYKITKTVQTEWFCVLCMGLQLRVLSEEITVGGQLRPKHWRLYRDPVSSRSYCHLTYLLTYLQIMKLLIYLFTDHEAPHHEVFSAPILPRLS